MSGIRKIEHVRGYQVISTEETIKKKKNKPKNEPKQTNKRKKNPEERLS